MRICGAPGAMAQESRPLHRIAEAVASGRWPATLRPDSGPRRRRRGKRAGMKASATGRKSGARLSADGTKVPVTSRYFEWKIRHRRVTDPVHYSVVRSKNESKEIPWLCPSVRVQGLAMFRLLR
jgi:hypothetical protein